MDISPHISYKEAVYSDTAKKLGIINIPDFEQLSKMVTVANEIFEPVRKHFGVPIHVSSFFRSIELNKVIGGSKTSQHVLGEAMDIDADKYGKITNRQLFNYIKDNLKFDQLIWEFGTDKEPDWIHVSFKKTNNRGEILKAYRDSNDNVKYKQYK